MATDPWQPLGTLLYHIVQFFLKTTGLPELHKGAPVSCEYPDEPAAVWLFCHPCETLTRHQPYFWVEQGDTDYECGHCGAVTYG